MQDDKLIKFYTIFQSQSMIQTLCDLEISMVNTDLPVTLAEHVSILK